MLYKTNNPHGGDIYEEEIYLDYSVNTNPFGTPKRVLKAMKKALLNVHHYPDPHCRKLVHAISEHEKVLKEYILCANGAAELIYSYCEAARPKRAVVAAPTFCEYSMALEQVGSAVEWYTLTKDKEFAIDDGFLEFLLKTKPEVVFLCNPNNPTGKIIPISILEKVMLFCQKNNARLFIDECFFDLADDSSSMVGYLTKYPQLFILKAFTKSYGMAGVRLGYGMSSDEDLLKRMSNSVQPWNVSLLAQAAGIAALGEEQFLQKTRKLISKERAWLKDKLESLGFWVCPSKANYLLIYGQKNLDTELKKQGIAIRNCNNFYSLDAGWYRIAVRKHDENEKLITAIKSVCEKR